MKWKETALRHGDPPLSTLGHRQARDVGRYLDDFIARENVHARNIVLLSSPFLRCIQTSNEILSVFQKTSGDVASTVSILPEYSVFEFDKFDQGYHDSLPSLTERKCYFPRVDEAYKSMFVPTLPEDRGRFLDRCDEVVHQLNGRYQLEVTTEGGEEREYNNAPRVIIIVTHAAGCVGLTRSASGLELQDINPSPPCGIYRLDKVNNANTWDIDHHSKEGGMNGYTKHITCGIGGTTVPWNNFGDRKIDNGYTGPPIEK